MSRAALLLLAVWACDSEETPVAEGDAEVDRFWEEAPREGAYFEDEGFMLERSIALVVSRLDIRGSNEDTIDTFAIGLYLYL